MDGGLDLAGMVLSARAELDENALVAGEDLIRFWLREEPAEKIPEFARQLARATYLEERFMRGLAGHLGQVLAQAMGGR